jgi:hypothetical protein
MKLALENNAGKTIRTFEVDADTAWVIVRKNTRRIELHRDLDRLANARIDYDALGEVSVESLAKSPLKIGSGRLSLYPELSNTATNQQIPSENSRIWVLSLTLMILFQIALIGWMRSLPEKTAKMEAEMKQQIVQIVKNIPIKQKTVPRVENNTSQTETQVQPKKVTQKIAAIKRMGALSVLGSLKNSNQKGGVNLGAANTTAGPGLGGNAGSGGVQTTLYGKGLVAAPLGVGGNMQGGGGYGTKGKGGGQAGYGKLSLIGSAGTASIPLGREALIEGGLDKDLVADVINRNMGQIRFCYEQGLQGNPSLTGRVAIDFTIGGTGQVKLATIANTSLNSQQVEECIVMRLKTWKFPLPEGGTDVKVSYPFMLRRAGQS